MGDQVLHRCVDGAGAPRPRSTAILNGSFDALTLPEAVEAVVKAIRTGERGVLCTVNVSILMMMRSDPELQRFVDAARWVVADGQPLVWASHLAALGDGRAVIPERVPGVELVDWLCARAELERFGVYFLGAGREAVEAAAALMKSRYPRLQIEHDDGYFDQAEAAVRARRVAASGARLLFVGMGVPRQERFIAQHWDQLGVNVAIGVGGSFEVWAGNKRRAPELAQRAGLEWAFRAIQEPRRLIPRYLSTNSLFLYLMARELITLRRNR